MGQLAEAPRAPWWIDRSGRAVACAVVTVAAAAWLLMLILPAMRMPGMGGAMSGTAATTMSAPNRAMSMKAGSGMDWSWTELAAFTASWALMMAAMMLPSATPMIALYSAVSRRRGSGNAAARTAMFAAPYAAMWALSGVPVYAMTIWIGKLERSHAWAHTAAPYAVAGTLLAAGVYQFTPFKRACLANCRHPLKFLAARWGPSVAAAARIGSIHAAYCFGCCALLTVVLVAAGAMGLAWVLLIAAAVCLEKLASRISIAPAVVGVALLALGMAVLLHPSLASHLRS